MILVSLNHLDLGCHILNEEISSWFGNLNNHQHLFLFNNKLAILSKVLDLAYNNLTGIIPPCLRNFSKHLSVLDLCMNSFHRTIVETFGEDYGRGMSTSMATNWKGLYHNPWPIVET
ncbi:hypothetical protein QQP08_026753 [Theobroma cacao]|nr:hypothetical protein QQP08_026753 [Theobroma cacao]